MKVNYGDKLGLIPEGVHSQEWWDQDANAVKDAINENDTVNYIDSNTVKFDRIQGYQYGAWENPIQSGILLNTANAVEGGCASMIWEGSTDPQFTGATIAHVSGSVTEQGIYSIYFHYIGSRVNINIFGQGGSVVPDVDPPAQMTITNITDSNLGDVTPPAQMSIISIT